MSKKNDGNTPPAGFKKTRTRIWTKKRKVPVGKIDHEEETKNPVAPDEQEENRLVMITKARGGGFILIRQSQMTTNVMR